MRKKIGFLVLGLIMTASAYAADEVKSEPKPLPTTKWDFSDSNVEFKAYLYDSETKAMYNGKDEDFIMKAKKYLDEKTFIQFKYDTDDSNPDYTLEILVNRKFNDKLEAQMDMDFTTGDSAGSTKGVRLLEDYDSEKAYIKYSPSSNLSFKFNPFDIDLTVGDEFETDNEQKTPGIQMEYKMSDSVKVYAGVGTGKYNNKTDLKLSNIKNAAGEEETVLGLKAGIGYAKDDTMFKIALATNTQDDTDITAAHAAPLKTAVSVIGETKSGNLSLTGEGIFTEINKSATAISGLGITDSETGYALFGKAKYTMGKNSPYVQVIRASEYAYFDDDDYSGVIGGGVQGHGGLTAIEVGNEYKLSGGLKIIPYVEMLSAKNKIFDDRDGKADDTAINFVTKVKVSF